MRVLYFAGLSHVIENNINLQNSSKLVYLSKFLDVDVFSHTGMLPDADGYDAFIGSSFGGFFALWGAARYGITGIGINPSLLLPERIEHHKQIFPEQLSIFSRESLNAMRMENPHGDLHVLINMDDEVLGAENVIREAGKNGMKTLAYNKGGHEAVNFSEEMLPNIKEILKI
ncbi:YqiA/YcfP family alpha/beta fold hydrolase [Limisalsivibrio acetivorans]|uniref:YqiA/YcfP family alpha/beta fold hydrolase n=1 Tax=Limisalsivibrio acetivorans TaxID=1304888 RepID=UPI0003B44843|nr:YqiA/YcfP family alpha/beta fold hydrolase [Limisalsivibrio acetivorans]